MQYPLNDRLSIEGMLKTRQSELEVVTSNMDSGTVLRDVRSLESSSGASVMLSWLDDLQRLVAGVDYDHVKAHVTAKNRLGDLLNRSEDRVGVYLNDTFSLGDFAITPSARFDHTEFGGDLFSPGFGITYALSENSVLRGYTARGYSITSLNRPDSTEKVWTSQVGFESADIPYLWLKGTLFRNDTWDITPGPGSTLRQRQLKHGYEVEARTLPFLSTSLSLGYTFIDGRDGDSGAIIPGVARHTANVGIRYDDSRYLRALLTGHYIDWNATGLQAAGKYGDVVWDLYLGRKVQFSADRSVELFFSMRNLFNAEQYILSVYKNTGRWAEVGVRCAF
jgi:vitamin B12 transporter